MPTSIVTTCTVRRADTLALVATLAYAPRPVVWTYPPISGWALDGTPVVAAELPTVSMAWGYMDPAVQASLNALLAMGRLLDFWLPIDTMTSDQPHVTYRYVRGWLERGPSSRSFVWDARQSDPWLLHGAEVV